MMLVSLPRRDGFRLPREPMKTHHTVDAIVSECF